MITYYPSLLDRKIKNVKLDYDLCQTLLMVTTGIFICNLIDYSIDTSYTNLGHLLNTGMILGIGYDITQNANNKFKSLLKRKYE